MLELWKIGLRLLESMGRRENWILACGLERIQTLWDNGPPRRNDKVEKIDSCQNENADLK
jgi:hypothetical protein